MYSFLSFLVNGSTTEDFKCSRGLRKGDPLFLFLFTLVAEGITLLVRRVIQSNIFSKFRLNENDSLSLT